MPEQCTQKSLLSQEKLSLKSWGLPRLILEKYATKGIENMFPWQVECLSSEGVLSGRNLVYSAPTSAGKTMVAEILTIQTVLERKKKVIIILPFVSVVREKMLYFQNLLSSSGVRVEGFMGSHAPPGGLRSAHIAICTIEKANSLINRLLEDQGLDSIGCVVVDEIHLLGDPHRGYLLELLLTKLKYMCLKDKSLQIQVVGMSATLPNMSQLAEWLDAALYTTDYRPIPLTEYIKVNSGVYEASTLELKYNIRPIVKFKSDPGDVIHLCLESLLSGHSVLVFCPSRNFCETSAQQIAAEFRRIGYEKGEVGLAVRAQLDGNALSDVLEQLKRCPAGLDQSLGRSIMFGVAFHHAGLTMDERDIVEGAFRGSVVRVLVATSTVSSGVNLPARRVLIRCPPRSHAADILTYRQMVGRAGRMGKDTAGESFLICNGSERVQGEQLARAPLPAVESSLGIGDLSSSLKRAILEVIASGVVSSSEDVERYTSCTFLASCPASSSELGDPLAACVEYLQTNEFIRVKGSSLGPTPLAEACLSASLPPDQGLKLLRELHRARQCFVLETELHVIYQVTPYSVADQWGQLDWLRVLSLWEDLPVSMKRVGELVGIEERFLVRAVRGTVSSQSHHQKMSIHRRFYTALALQDLVNEVPLAQVAVKFDCSKGLLQSLQQSASTFAGMVTQFSRRLGWSNVELLVSQFCARLQYGAQRELLDLLRLDCLTAVQARALYNAGIQALADLATASNAKVEKALSRATPFQSEVEESESSDKCRIWLVGRCAASETQAANLIIQEARQYLERELGLQSANWGDLNTVQDQSASDISLTQSLETLPRPIGQEVVRGSCSDENKENTRNNESSADGALVNSQVSGNKNEINSSGAFSSSMINVSQNHMKENIVNVIQGKDQLQEGSVSCVKNEDHLGKKEKPTAHDCFKSPKLILKNDAEKVKKRSLDLFDSPEQLEVSVNHDRSGMNIEEKNILLNLPLADIENSSSIFSSKDNRTAMQKEISEDTHSEKNQQNGEITIPKVKPNVSPSLLFSVDNRVNSPIGCNTVTTPNSQFHDNKSFFFDSPLPNEVCEVREEEFDANIGGESLLERSSFVEGSVGDELNLLDRNIGEGSLLEMSSFIVEAEGRKRKRTSDETYLHKRLKISSSNSKNISVGSDELQVSHVTSTNYNLIPIKTSTPTVSKNFQSAANFESPFFSNEDIKYEEMSDLNTVQTNFSNTKNVEPKSNLSTNCVQESASFELKLSRELSGNDLFCDSELIIDSKICDMLDNKNDSFKNQPRDTPCKNVGKSDAICEESFSFSGSVNIDSRLNALLDVQTSLVIKTDCDSAKSSPSESNCVKNSVNVNKISLSDSVDIDSKVNVLIDGNVDNGKENVLGKVEKQQSDSNLFSSQLNLNTQLCGLLDQGNLNKEINNKSIHIEGKQKQFENSEFDINTQLCDILDNNSLKNLCKENKSKSEKPLWTESMEVKEIMNFPFDEDTVFGTPEVQHKSLRKFYSKTLKIDSIKTQEISSLCNETIHRSKSRLLNNKDSSSNSTPLKTNCQKKLDIHKEQLYQNVLKENNKIPTPDKVIKDQCNRVKCNPAYLSANNDVKSKETPADNELEVEAKTSGSVKKENRVNSSLTTSVLEAAFACSFDQPRLKPGDDEVAASQQSPVTPLKELPDRLPNINSPTMNMSNTQVQIITVSDSDTRKEFRKEVLAQKSVALSLSLKTVEDKDGEGVIGARFMKKKCESSYPCCHQGTAVSAVAVCWEESRVYILSLNQNNYKANVDLLAEVWSRRELTVCVWGAKRAVRLLHQCCHLQCEARLSDPSVAQWLLTPHANTSTLKQLARLHEVSAPQCSEESGFQALLVRRLSRLLKIRLKQAGLYKAYTDTEMPTQKLLAAMEEVGVGWDRQYADRLWTAVEEKMADLQSTLFNLCGKKFNVRSRSDMARIKITMMKSSEAVQAEFNGVLRNWRVLNSLKSRNMSHLLLLEGDRVRGSWETHTVTGRISMTEPNLQHVPRDISVDGQLFSLRSAFVAHPGHTLVSADFCQLELRLLAHFSQDPGLLFTFSQPGDVFTVIAAEWNNTPPDQVTECVRQHAKQLCYGLIYGMGLRTLAEEMALEEPKAAQMVESFHRTYPGIQSYVARCVAQCRAQGHVTTISGRQRHLPDISSHNKAQRAQAERQAVNTSVQGSAADIAKTAMLHVHRAVRQRGLTAQLIIHLHDELIYEVADKDQDEFVKIIRREMEGAVSLSVPLPVKVKRGPSWGQLQLID